MFLQTVKWDITKRCFLSCWFCANQPERDGSTFEDIPFDTVLSIISKLSACGVKHIQFLGGEPFYRKDFIDILTFINTKTTITTGVNTNGVMLKKETADAVLKLDCLNSIIISLDGLKETHDATRGARVYDTIMANIAYLVEQRRVKEHKLGISINTVVNKVNKPEIAALIKTLSAAGVDEWIGLQLVNKKGDDFVPEFTTAELIDILLLLGALKKEVACKITPKLAHPLVIDYINKTHGFELNISQHSCGAGLSFAYIDWNGFVYPCDRFTKDSNTEQIYNENHLKPVNLAAIEPIQAVTSPLFKAFNFAYVEPLESSNDPCRKCDFYLNACNPCIALRHFQEYKVCAPECEYVFKKEQERLEDEIKNSFTCGVKVKMSEYVTLHCGKDAVHLFDHKNNQVYKLHDAAYSSMAKALTLPQEAVKECDLITLWFKEIAQTKSFVNSSANDVIELFDGALRDLISNGVVDES